MLIRSLTLLLTLVPCIHLAGHVEIRIELGNLLDCAQREPEHLPNLLLLLFRANSLQHTVHKVNFSHRVQRNSVGCGVADWGAAKPSRVRPSPVGCGVAQ
jgi:hypothetical protein